jgi:hypothetical protein
MVALLTEGMANDRRMTIRPITSKISISVIPFECEAECLNCLVFIIPYGLSQTNAVVSGFFPD